MSTDPKKTVIKSLDDYIKDGDERIPAEAIHKHVKEMVGEDYYRSPGHIMKVHRMKNDLTQKQLADKLEIKQHHISEMERNKRAISRKMAMKLGKVLNCNYKDLL